MPRRPSSGGSVIDAFEASNPRIQPGSVKMTYIGKDKFGQSIYKFTYRTRASRGPVIASSTVVVSRPNGGWQFSQPNKAPGVVSPEAKGNTIIKADQSLIDRAIVKINEMVERGVMSVGDARLLIGQLPNMAEPSVRTIISRGGSYAQTPSVREITSPEAGRAQDRLDDIFTGIDLGGGGGGGGGGGSIGPIYRAPDKRVVTEFVKGELKDLVGDTPKHLIGPAVELFMKDDRRNFASPKREIDPKMSVLEFIRNSEEYKAIHALRPEDADERSWIADRAQQAVQGGLATEQVGEFAIDQATVGGDIQDVAEAAAVSQFQRTGQAPDMIMQQIRGVAQAMFQRVK